MKRIGRQVQGGRGDASSWQRGRRDASSWQGRRGASDRL